MRYMKRDDRLVVISELEAQEFQADGSTFVPICGWVTFDDAAREQLVADGYVEFNPK